MKVAIRYFTGTGNTARACSIIEGVFRNAGWTIDTRELRSAMSDPYGGIEDADLLVIAFPALGFSQPVVMRKWLGRLPKKNKATGTGGAERRAAVLCVGGAIFEKGRYVPGWGGGAPMDAERQLVRRGWNVTGVAEVSYPENWTQVSNPPGEREAADIRTRNDPAVRSFAAELVQGGRPRLARSAAGVAAINGVAPLFRLVGRRMLSRLFIADSSCTGCGLCSRTCPALAIRMKRGRPRWNTRCVACNRCINLCPSKSIVTSTLALGLQLSFAILSVAAALSFPLSDELHILGRGAVRAAALVALTIFQLGPYSWLLARISRGKRSRRAFEASFMADYRRYLAPDFKPTGTE